jgi:hypothetical protein
MYSMRLRSHVLWVNHHTILLIVVETSLPQSSAGNGSILRTQRLIERSAMIENMIFQVTHWDTISINPHPIPIGPESISVASLLSVGVAGDMSLRSVFVSTSSVI